jgi:P-type Cu2+ transporter
VQVAAASRLFGKGMILKATDGLERLAEVDTIVLDKTGTLTTGLPELERPEEIEPATLRAAAGLAAASHHPYARALVRAAAGRLGPVAVAPDAREHAGAGMSRPSGAGQERLGSAWFVGVENPSADHNLWYADGTGATCGFAFSEKLRPGAAKVVGQLRQGGFQVELLSGDRPQRVARMAAEAGIAGFRAAQNPAAKLARLAELKAQGRRVLMIGDGLNDAPALAAGHASLSPATAADISQNAADVIWQGASLEPLAELLGVARASRSMALQNFAIALAYNAVSVPLAMLGHVTPLAAALAMSTSSIAVTLNALRLRSKKSLQMIAPR